MIDTPIAFKIIASNSVALNFAAKIQRISQKYRKQFSAHLGNSCSPPREKHRQQQPLRQRASSNSISALNQL